jgi:hypothetical protein
MGPSRAAVARHRIRHFWDSIGYLGSGGTVDPIEPCTAVELAVGDDVNHDLRRRHRDRVEPGGLIGAFSSDGSERKLMAEYARSSVDDGSKNHRRKTD